jgi:sRNA-binding carbon storage regulator CsrA
MLLIGREVGQGVYIGHGVRVTVTAINPTWRAELSIEHGLGVAVSGPLVTAGDHVRLQVEAEAKDPGAELVQVTTMWIGRRASVLIGRGVRVIVVEVQTDGMVRVGIEAPKHIAVSRDDFTLADHRRFQAIRERPPSVQQGGTS